MSWPLYIPKRGDAVESWLKSSRDRYRPESPRHITIELLLRDYQSHADRGAPLDPTLGHRND